MKNIKEPLPRNDGASSAATNGSLFDAGQFGWWNSALSPNALRALETGFEGVFRDCILHLMPAEKLGENFTNNTGRPSKELYSMAGLMLMAEFRNLTGDETARAYTFDASVQFALDLPRDHQYVCPRTIDTYRRLFRENNYAQEVFFEVTSALVKGLNICVKRQRLDSTHVVSNMANFSRFQLLATGIKRFLNALKKSHLEEFETLDESFRRRYQGSDQRLYFGEVIDPSKVTPEEKRKVLSQLRDDLTLLIEGFDDDKEVSQLPAYQKMERLFNEHFEVDAEGEETVIKLRKVSEAEDGSKAHTLQNTSDEDAGYGGHKGSGHQAQIAQSLPPVDENDEVEGPGFLTCIIPESAAEHDSHGVKNMIECQELYDLKPDQCTADTSYGSDENVTYAKGRGVELISPVSGKKVAQPGEGEEAGKATETKKKSPKRIRLDERRELEETDEWKGLYAKRSGIEGVNRALDLTTGFKHLRVRGKKAVGHCLYMKAAGWNILTAATIMARRARFGCHTPLYIT